MICPHKSWFSPLVAVAFIAVAVTGLFLTIHLRLPGVHALHLWSGMVFVIVGAVHLFLNRRAFVDYLKKSPALWSAAVGVLVLVLIAVALPSGKQAGLRSGAMDGHHGHAARGRW